VAAEVVSPSSARHDRVRKRPHYQRHRVSEYWIVDDMSRTFERWTPDDERPELLAEKLVWHPAGATDPFVLDLVEFFKDVAAEDDPAQ
jgi:Uma2 family endonuclease